MGRRQGTTRTPAQQAVIDRNSTKYLKLKKQFRARSEAVKAPCHLCGRSILYDMGVDDPESFELDHFFPVETHPELFEDPGNFRASHQVCNRSRGSKPVTPTLGTPSEAW